MTSGPLRPQYPTSAERSDHTGEPEPFQPPLHSRPCANAPLAKSTPAPALPASNKASASLPSKEKAQKGQLLASRAVMPAVRIASSPTKTARIGWSDTDTDGRVGKVHTLYLASSIDPSLASNIQIIENTNSISLSSVRNRQEPLPRSQNETSELFMSCSLSTREPRPSALSKKMRIASCAFPYARVRQNEAKQRLTAVEFMKGLHESLDVDAKSLRCNEGLETDAESLHCAESIDADVHVLRRRENSKANKRELCCMPIIPQWSSPGEMLSSTMEQSLEKKAVSEDNGQTIPARTCRRGSPHTAKPAHLLYTGLILSSKWWRAPDT